MFKLMIATLLLISMNAWALSDQAFRKNIETFLVNLKQERTLQQKEQAFEKFQDELFDRINSFDVAVLEKDADIFDINELEDFRSLNELQGYLDLIVVKDLNSEGCKTTKDKIEASASKEGGVVPEAVEALKILASLCVN